LSVYKRRAKFSFKLRKETLKLQDRTMTDWKWRTEFASTSLQVERRWPVTCRPKQLVLACAPERPHCFKWVRLQRLFEHPESWIIFPL